MNKVILTEFIDKYNIEKQFEKVRWNIDSVNKTWNVSAASDEKDIICNITIMDIADVVTPEQFAIFNTSKLKSMLSVLPDDIDITINKNTTGNVTSLLFSGNKMEIQYITADLSVVPEGPKLKKLPEFDIDIVIDKDFIDSYSSAFNALKSDTFSFVDNDGKIELILGYSTLNTDRIKLAVNTTEGKDKLTKILTFNAKYFKEILSQNKDIGKGTLSICTQHELAYIQFLNDTYNCKYFLKEKDLN